MALAQTNQTYKDTIFREYDIRGIVGKDFDIDFAATLARSYAQFIRQHVKAPANGRKRFCIAVGRDVRDSGQKLAPLFQSVLLEEGFDVFDLGICPTPLTYFSLFHYDVDGAVSITGSHNPSEYNGFKMCVGRDSLHGPDIQELKRIASGLTAPTGKTEPGVRAQKPVIADYQRFVGSQFKLKNRLKVVVDAGNATGGTVAPELLRTIGCEVIELFCDLDGRFPNHHPDPTVEENLQDLKEAVVKHNAHVGIAYDGDADRIGAVDETGRTLWGDELMVLFSREILSRKPGAKIIGEVKCSHRMYNDIAKHGGKPIMWKTGHSLIKSKLKSEKAELAGEMSGHIFFSDRYFGYDDAIYSSIRLLEIIDQVHPRRVSELLADLPKTVNTPELRVDCPDEQKFEIVARVKAQLSKQFKVVDIDGVRIETDYGWGLLRASNTQPVVVMRFEANSQQQLDQIRAVVEAAFKEAQK